MDVFGWAVDEAGRSPRFRAQVDRLRRLAAGADRANYARDTGPLAPLPWPELKRLAAKWNDEPSRPRAHRNADLSTSDGRRHVRDYLAGCRHAARLAGLTDAFAEYVHELVGRDGYRLALPPSPSPSAPPAYVGPLASTLAAHITGASWGSGATAGRQAWYRHRPSAADYRAALEHALAECGATVLPPAA